ARHLRLEKSGRANQHGVGAVFRRAPARPNRRLRRLAARAHDETPIARDRLPRRDDDLIGLEVVRQHRFAVRSKHDEAGERAPDPPGKRRPQPRRVDAIAIVEWSGDGSEDACQVHWIDPITDAGIFGAQATLKGSPYGVGVLSPRLSSCSTRFSPRTTRNMAAAGLRSHGKSANTRMFVDASCSIVPQLATSSGNPRPTYDSVASATMNAGMSTVTWTARKPP